MKHKRQNKLKETSSPYLRQHAENPVNWYPWGEEALEKARSEDKPILLSVGYSSCHWCHVMAHESFEDEATAEVMNRHFVNVKVDREERPDIDKIYQTAHALMTQRSGGWPLTIFLSPEDLSPFFSGTYFPNEARHQLPSFKEVLNTLHNYFINHRKEIQNQCHAVKNALEKVYAANRKTPKLHPKLLQTARDTVVKIFDARYGGFGTAPKFPQPSFLELLLHYLSRPQSDDRHDPQAAQALLRTLSALGDGGVYDQIGGGFYRYAVDERWMIPHFEKMLYDNGWLLGIFIDAGVLSGNPSLTDKARETADWAIREMQADEGGFYSSIDADSESEEGRFYVWDKQEIARLLDGDEMNLAERRFGLEAPPNFEGRRHLYAATPIETIARENRADVATVKRALAEVRRKLFDYRKQRVHPHQDRKILTSWNALMIRGMAKAAFVLCDSSYEKSAQKAFDFIRSTLWQDGMLKSSWCDHRTQSTMYLDDVAFLLDAVMYLLQCRWNTGQFEFARSLADLLIDKFEDDKNGGFFFTPEGHEKLLQRPRTMHDEALPCGYGVAASALQRLGFLCGHEPYLKSAERALTQAAATLAHEPASCAGLLRAYDEHRTPPDVIILRGEPEDLEAWQRKAARCFAVGRLCLTVPNDIEALPPAIDDKKAATGTTAYVCRGSHCLEPLRNLSDFETYLTQNSARIKS